MELRPGAFPSQKGLTMFRSRTLYTLILVSCLFPLLATAAPPSYLVEPLNLPPTQAATAIDRDTPTVVGVCQNQACVLLPTQRDLGTLSPAADAGSRARAVACSVVVGTSGAGPFGMETHAFRYDLAGTTMVDLHPAEDFTRSSSANDVNCTGDIVGFREMLVDGLSRIVPVRWRNGVIEQLPGLPGGNGEGVALALNAAGDATGFSKAADGQDHCVVWPASGGMQECHAGTRFSQGNDINDSGQVAVAADGFASYLWSAATGAVLQPPLAGDTWTLPQRLTQTGHLLGQSFVPAPCPRCPSPHHAVALWELAVAYDLNLQTGLAL